MYIYKELYRKLKATMEDIIKCSTCKKKLLNNKEQVKIYVGYNRLNQRFKCCIRCWGCYGKKKKTEKDKEKKKNKKVVLNKKRTRQAKVMVN